MCSQNSSSKFKHLRYTYEKHCHIYSFFSHKSLRYFQFFFLLGCLVGAYGGLRPLPSLLIFHHHLHQSDIWPIFSSSSPVCQISLSCYVTMSNFLSYCSITQNVICEITVKSPCTWGIKDKSSQLWLQCSWEARSFKNKRLFRHQAKLYWKVLEPVLIDSFC